VIATTVPLGWRMLIYFVVGVAAGISNGVAGGGTFLTFPSMLALGVPALQANVSSSVGVLPSYVGGMREFRHALGPHWRLIRQLLPACIAGVGAGAALLLFGSPEVFRSVVPWLIAAGTLLFAAGPWITKRIAHLGHHGTRRKALFVGIFTVSIYGGYFGAGLGILLLAVMGLTVTDEISTLQGLRSVLSTVINATAALIFIVRGHLVMEAVSMLLVGTLLGGVLGALLISRLSPKTVRVVIVAVGIATAIRLWVA
jgi:uncharacterized membrane protein YfcA